MKILIFTDLHYQLKNMDVAKSCLEQVVKLAHKENINDVLFLGDFFNDKAIIRSEVLRESFHFIKNSGLRWTMLVGNHDLETTIGDGIEHSLELFKELDNVKIIDKFEELTKYFKSTRNIYAFPYYKNVNLLKNDLKKVHDTQSIIFMHQGIDGFNYSTGISNQSELKPEDLKLFHLVISGHIHTHQRQDNMIYIGSPFTHSFGESFDEKCVYILTDESNKGIVMNIHQLSLPMHRTFEITIEHENDIFNMLSNSSTNDFIKVVVNARKEVLNKVNKSLFPQFKNLSLQKREIKDDKTILIDENLSYNRMIETYISNLETQLNKKELFKLNNEILENIDK